jgi:hypothetical protein
MNSNTQTTEIKDRKILLSTLWIFAMMNYLYCDIMSLMDPLQLKQLITGTAGTIHITQGFLLGAAILMEIPIAMIILSRALKYKANRLANILAGTIMTVFQISSLFVGKPANYYLIFSMVEIAGTLFIVWYAWRWAKHEGILN